VPVFGTGWAIKTGCVFIGISVAIIGRGGITGDAKVDVHLAVELSNTVEAKMDCESVSAKR